MYTRSTSSHKNIDDLAFSNGNTSFVWKVTGQAADTTGYVDVVGTKKSETEDATSWTCTIKGTKPNDQKELKIEEQIKNFLTINEKGEIKDKNRFQKFIENCIRLRTTRVSKETSISQIELGALEIHEEKYRFKESELKKIYENDLFESKLKEEIFIPQECLKLENGSYKECSPDDDKLQKINFENKPAVNLTVSNNENTKLRIEKTKEIDVFPNGLKFIFETQKDVEIKEAAGNEKIILKTGITEFRVTAKNDGKYAISKAWDTTALSSKVGLVCQPSSGTKTCHLKKDSTTNVYKTEEKHFKKVTFEGNLILEENVDGYNKGLKLTVSGDKDIDLKSGNPKTTVDKLLKPNKSYEIGTKTIKGEDAWFLIEKSS